VRPGDPDIVLISCYELGRQPLGLAGPLAHLHAAGLTVATRDLAVERLQADHLGRPRLVAISTPMHTALRLGVAAAAGLRQAHPEARICFFGLYAGLNAEHLFARGLADYIITGEVEEPLAALARTLATAKPATPTGVMTPGSPLQAYTRKPRWLAPRRQGLPALEKYVHLSHSGRRTPAAAVEASRGCRHVCRHCPLTPIYRGRFMAVPLDTVLQDVAAVAHDGAGHITFADPDFLNGPTHALRVAREMHRRFPELTFDFTAKVEHLVAHAGLLPDLAEQGGLFVVSAVESLSDTVLAHLDKGHTRADVALALAAVRRAGMILRPTLLPFTPWATTGDLDDLLAWIADEDLAGAVDPVQMTIRLLVPPGSPLASSAAMRPFLTGLAAADFAWGWRHPDPHMDLLQERISARVAAGVEEEPELVHRDIARLAAPVQGLPATAFPGNPEPAVSTVSPPPPRHRDGWPRLTEPWFC
jgi:radical SAM superfamily enzyme YgiQ (UPF0313 family)